jgi:hypothetical protein
VLCLQLSLTPRPLSDIHRAHSSPQQDPSAAADADAQAEEDLALLRDLSNEDDWGLDALTAPGFSSGAGRQPGRRSLIDELTAAAEEGGAGLGASGSGANVQWGGTAGTTGEKRASGGLWCAAPPLPPPPLTTHPLNPVRR